MENKNENKWKHYLRMLQMWVFIFTIVLLLINRIYLHDEYSMFLSIILINLYFITTAIIEYIEKRTKYDAPESEYRKYLLTELESGNDSNRQNMLEEQKVKEQKAEKQKTEEQKETHIAAVGKKDIIALMLKNNDEINDYFKISKRQAKSSFMFSIIACIIGITMIGLSIYGFFAIKDTQFAIIGIVGGAITELIAGTVLVIHNKSALQLNYYYDALHENEKTLSAINLADKLPEDQRVQMYIEIIKAQIRESKMNNKSQEKQ